MLSNRIFWINVKKCIYERVIEPTALYGAEAWDMRRCAERMTVDVLEMKCLRSLGVSRMDRIRNENVRRRTGIEMELASRVARRV